MLQTPPSRPTQGLGLPAEPLGHVPALDGIRALAVTAVLLFHGDIPGTEGGFLGVSVFFTLSGFLITSLLLRQWTGTGAVDLRAFWSRRFRRLLPASWLTMALVLMVGAIGWWDTEQLRSLRGDVPWSLAELVNWHFIAVGTAYGDDVTPPSPLEHFWSLAIEQQFYVVLPLVVVGVLVARSRRAADPGRRLRTLVAVLAVAAVGSAVANGLLARGSVDRAYLGTDTRAAELLAGALLACVLLRRLRFPGAAARRWAIAAGLAGAIVLVRLVQVARLSSEWLYPWGLLLTAASTCALIVAALQLGPVSAVLRARPLPELGRISYGVYLLHWPIFLLLTPARVGWGPWPLLVLRVAVTVPLAVAMFRLLEVPVRTGGLLRTRTLRFAVPAAALVLLVGSQLVTRDLPPPPDFLEPREPGDVVVREAPTTTPTTSTPAPTTAASDAGAATTTPSSTEPPPPPVPPQRVLLVGDSVAASLEDALGDVLTERGVAFASVAAPGCGVVTGDPADAQGAPLEIAAACDGAIPQLQRDGVATGRPDLVVVLSSWESGDRIVDGTWYSFDSAEGQAALRDLYDQTFDRLGAGGAAVALATLPDNVDGEVRAANPEVVRRNRLLSALLVDVAATSPRRVTVVPFAEAVCPTTPCPTQVDGVTLRPRDGAHFDEPEGARLAAERLADQLLAIDLARVA